MSQATGEQSVSAMRPYGVWAVISPFNFPLVLAAGMISAALLTGNTVVFKPTSKAPLTGLKLFAAWEQTGIPGGALNIITGPGEPFGAVVVDHPDVAGIAFTGSRDAGMWLRRNFALRQSYPKPFVAEMGSKNPAIVTASADLDKAVEGVLRGAFGYSGQKCSATSRVYVESAVAPDFIEKLRVKTEQLIVGDPRQADVFVGPLIDESALTRFADAVKDGLSDGGILVAGGTVLRDGVFNKGCYVRPTILMGLARGHHLFNEELFVPFLLVDIITSLEEGLREANATEYGLTAGIFQKMEVRLSVSSRRCSLACVTQIAVAVQRPVLGPVFSPLVGGRPAGLLEKELGDPTICSLTSVNRHKRGPDFVERGAASQLVYPNWPA